MPEPCGQTVGIVDLTIVAIPGYFASMGAEYVYLKRRAEREGPSSADYERKDTIASLAMGMGSLVAPLVAARLLAPITPGKGRFAKVLVAGAAGAVAVTTTADVVARRLDALEADDPDAEDPQRHEPRRVRRRRIARVARKVASVGGVASVVAGGVAIATAWNAATTSERVQRFAGRRDLGRGPLAWTVAIFGWDFIYYWNHRWMHTSRYMWAHHVAHHSSERYNLSTALRQPVAGAFVTFVREDDDEPVVYGLTKNIESFSPARIATHEWSDMFGDVYQSEDWSDRLSYVLRGPGWAYERHAVRDAVPAAV